MGMLAGTPPALGSALRPVIDNPISGERIVIRTSGEESNGALLAFDLYLPSGGKVPSGHTHPGQTERFTVLEGRLRFRLGLRVVRASAGQALTVPAGTPHWFRNDGPEEAHVLVEVRPALRMQQLFERSGDLGRRGNLLGTHLPRPGDLAVFLREFEREVAVPFLPRRLVHWLLAPIVWLAHGEPHRP